MSTSPDPIQDKISQVSKKADDTYAMLSNCYLELQNLKLEHSHLCVEVAQKSKSEDLTSEVAKLYSAFSPLQKKILNLDDHKDMLQALVREIKNGFQEYTSNVSVHATKLDDLFKGIEALKSSISLARGELDANMNAAVSGAKKELQGKMDALPIPRSVVAPDEMRAHVTSALEGVALDARNAFMSSQNNEMRLDVIEKKIENILIKIKNVELKAQ